MTGASLHALFCIAVSAGTIGIFILTRRFLLSTNCRRLFVELVMSLAIFKAAAYYLFPASVRLANDWRFDLQAMVLPSEITFVYIIDFISYAVWALTLILSANLAGGKFRAEDSCDGNITKREKIFVFLVFLLFIVSFKDSLATVLFPAFPEAEDAYFNPFGPFAIACGQVLGCSVVVMGAKTYGRVNWVSGVVCFLMFLGFASLSGVRGLIVYPLLWILFLNLTVRKSVGIYLAGAVLLVALGLLHGQFMSLRVFEGAGQAGLTERLAGAGEKGERSLADEVVWRFSELTRMSVGFKRLADDGDYAGFKPVVSAFYAPMPRFFFPDKPWPGSIDEDRYGSGMYIIHRRILDTSNMSEFSTGMHAYWEFGLPGVLICSAIAGLYTSFCMALFSRFGITGLILLVLSFKPWGYNEPKIWMPELVLQITQIIIPLLALWFFAVLLAKIPQSFGTFLSSGSFGRIRG